MSGGSVPHIRPFREDDRPSLRAIYLASRVETFRWLDTSGFRPEDFDASVEGERIWVAETDGEVVGFASVWTADDFLHNLFVHPAHVGTGAGRALLLHCLADAAGPMTLKCLVRNERALAFYRAHGWTEVERGSTEHGEHAIMRSGAAPAAAPTEGERRADRD